MITNDGKLLVGQLRGVDQTTNIVLANCQERIFCEEEGCTVTELGLFMVRGDNM